MAETSIMTLLTLANIVIFFSALTGMLLIAHKNKLGFVVFLLVEISMGYIGMATASYGLVVTAIMYAVMNVYSYIKWTRCEY